jgi:Zn-dependent protease with chaperone function
MPFLLLLVLTLTCLPRDWPEPPGNIGPLGSAIVTWLAIALMAAVAWLASRRLRGRLQRDPSSRPAVAQRYATFRRWHFYALLAVYFGLVLAGWGRTVNERLIDREIAVPGIHVVLLAPLVAGLILVWASYHPLDKSLAQTSLLPAAEPFPPRWMHVAVQARHNFLLVAPPLVLMFVQQVVVALWPDLQGDPYLSPLIGIALLGTMYIGIPWMLRLLLNLQPLPPGPLRERLLATAGRLSFRFNDILIWNTRHTMVNALVTGPLPWLRYVILTDRLVTELTPEEIEAVFGHEVGHIKHHHLLFYFGFLLASLVAVIGLWNLLADWLNQTTAQAWLEEHMPAAMEWLAATELLSALPLLALLGAYIFLVFGFLSRRCERQADIYGCRTVSVPVFVQALEKVARLNGISRDRPGWLMSWQHSTIAKRVDFLERMRSDPAIEPRFQRRVGLVKLAMLLSLTVVLLVVLGKDNFLVALAKLGLTNHGSH